MAIYDFICTKCGTAFRRLYSPEQFEAQENRTHCKCGYAALHVPGAATSKTMEVIDNGLSPRRLERLADAERIFKERELAHDQKFGNKEDEDE